MTARRPLLAEWLYETIAFALLAVALGLLAWSAVERVWVVGGVLRLLGADGVGWVLALVAGLLAHVLAWAVLVIPLRALSPKPRLGDEIRSLPQAVRQAMADTAAERDRAEASPDPTLHRRYNRKLGYAGIGIGLVVLLGTAAGAVATGRLLLVLTGFGAVFLLGGLWMVLSGRGLPGARR